MKTPWWWIKEDDLDPAIWGPRPSRSKVMKAAFWHWRHKWYHKVQRRFH